MAWVVTTNTGLNFTFLTQEERDLYAHALGYYRKQNVFTHESDQRTLERLVFLEVMIFRYQSWLAVMRAYDTVVPRALDPKDVTDIQRQLKDLHAMVSSVQTDLGLTRSQREKEQHDSVGSYITQLKQAAREHGIRRDKQTAKAIELFMTLKSLCGAYRRSDDAERKKMDLESAEDIVNWVLDVAAPQFDEIDSHYRANNQKMWLRKL